MADKWIRRWDVPSESDPEKSYVVAQDVDGDYGCSCPAWRFRGRRECRHIEAVKNGEHPERSEPKKQEPEFVLANVRGVTPVMGDRGEKGGKVLVPLIPIGDTHFQATVVYDLERVGFSWSYIKNRYDIARMNRKKAIREYVETYGRKIYGPWVGGSGFQGFEIVPV